MFSLSGVPEISQDVSVQEDSKGSVMEVLIVYTVSHSGGNVRKEVQ